jgi:hypothetical protein
MSRNLSIVKSRGPVKFFPSQRPEIRFKLFSILGLSCNIQPVCAIEVSYISLFVVLIKVTLLNLVSWLLAIAIPFVTIFWIEMKKLEVRT